MGGEGYPGLEIEGIRGQGHGDECQGQGQERGNPRGQENGEPTQINL